MAIAAKVATAKTVLRIIEVFLYFGDEKTVASFPATVSFVIIIYASLSLSCSVEQY
jgi:hypothetical protein